MLLKRTDADARARADNVQTTGMKSAVSGCLIHRTGIRAETISGIRSQGSSERNSVLRTGFLDISVIFL